MIRAKATTHFAPLEEALDFLDNFDEVVSNDGQAVVDEWSPELLAELRVVPGSPKYPIEWTSEKQRKAFFASNGFGQGIPYKRRDKGLPEAWEVLNTTTDGVFSILVINRDPAAKFVYGSLAKDRAAALLFQQKFHRNTGWQAARNTVYLWLDVMEKAFRREILDVASSSTKRRAYTR